MSNGNGPTKGDPDRFDFNLVPDTGPPFDGYPPGILTAVEHVLQNGPPPIFPGAVEFSPVDPCFPVIDHLFIV